jgi:hypothetical protein
MRVSKVQLARHSGSVLLVCALGLVLRLLQANAPLWGDETVSWVIARRTPFWAMWQLASNDPTPPLFYALLHFSLPWTGDSPFGVRLPSLVCSVLVLLAVYWGMRQCAFDHAHGLAAMLLAAGSSVLIYYSHEARAYALLALLGTLSVGLLVRCLCKPGLASYLLYAAVLVLLAYTHGYALLLFASQLFVLIVYKRWKLSTIPLAAMIVAAMPLLLRMLNKTYLPGGAGTPTNMAAVFSLVNSLSIGTIGMQDVPVISKPELLSYPNPMINRVLPFVGILILVALLWWSVQSYRRADPTQRQSMLVLWACMVLPALLALFAGSLPVADPQWLLRGLIYLWPLYAMAAAAACRSVRATAVLLPAILLVNLLSLYPYYTRYTRFEGTSAFQQLEQRTTSSDLIIADPWYMHEFIRYYYRGAAPLVGYEPRKGWLDIERMQLQNLYYLYPLPAQPTPRGDVYVFYLSDDLRWANMFRGHRIFVYDPATITWREYQGRAKNKECCPVQMSYLSPYGAKIIYIGYMLSI